MLIKILQTKTTKNYYFFILNKLHTCKKYREYSYKQIHVKNLTLNQVIFNGKEFGNFFMS